MERQRLLTLGASTQVERVLVALVVIAIVVAMTWVMDHQMSAGLGRGMPCEAAQAC